MATHAATKRLTKEYKTISANPPPYITAHPSENNILEWHYILTGPPATPYENGQYWGTLIFPPDYPFAPPAIRMHTPSGRFQPSTRLCLSISDFHPKSFNPAWEVSTILLGLQSFMTSEEMTTGSVRASEGERKMFAQRTKWSNATGNGSWTPPAANAEGKKTLSRGNVKAGDGGAKFAQEWPEVYQENWKWMRENNIDPMTGNKKVVAQTSQASGSSSCSPGVGAALRRRSSSKTAVGAVVEGGQAVRERGESWLGRNKWYVLGAVIFGYVLIARILGEGAAAKA